jgi:hypothetical protein
MTMHARILNKRIFPVLTLAAAVLLTLTGCSGLPSQSQSESLGLVGAYQVCTRAYATRVKSLAEDESARCHYSSLANMR